MKTTATTLFTLALATVTIGVPLATNPYAPVTGQCEANAESAVTTVNITDLLEQESEWLVGRKNVTDTAWEAYITNLGLVDLDTAAVAGGAPRIALAASGGGLRAMLSGAGVFTAFDAQVPASIETKTGGILQMSTYMGGLSGGSWLVSSLLANEMPPVNEWAKTYININTTVFYPGTNDIEAVANYKRFFTQINAKEAAGFDTNLVDLWAKGMAYQILNKIPSYGNDMLLSDFQTEGPFSSFEAPFPILVAASFRPGNSAFDYGDVFDWNPYHAGSYSPNISAFIELSIVGTSYNNEELASNDGCVTRFDNLQYTFATSSAAFALPDLSRTKTAVINQVLPDILNLTVTPEGAENFTVTRMPSFITDMEGPKPYFSELPDFYLGDGGLASSGFTRKN
ncbi:hypothetical protein, variant [Sphaeroforma arctica JP610]|uniref:lysophospholipase n=1 Tax=Sphaeroforma arctica JP610 TaxID=667725 RepID=A0A0L0G8R7_9EUKA|nr:hypothetical protein, variant [Sphaeroforma arctica JP610]KNC85400.1 hypothetical protein, variant [Sphaeroforma arctica JP610]|eukprot:XP_014159303.1 hypothetical protein, variant [Sphaeroforma arctica JP610]